jgi:hypothetical protein
MPYIILICVLAVIILLLLLRVKLIISYDDQFVYKFKYCFISFRINNKDKGKNKKEEQAAFKKDKIKIFLQNFETISDFAKKLIKDTANKICVELLEIKLTVCENDAAKTAILYGVANSVIYPGVNFVSNFVDIKTKQIKITPLFIDGSSNVQFECIVSMRLCSIIWIAIKRVIGFIISVIKDKRTKNKLEGSAVK